jgi:uncharacterized protein YjiS (DUF1127 family)
MLLRILDTIARRRKINQTIKELSAMSDYELADIGINRGMIRSVAMEADYNEQRMIRSVAMEADYNEQRRKENIEKKDTSNVNLKGWV